MAISFNNTENAFRGKSDSDLNRSYLLFSLIGNPLLVRAGATLGPLALNIGFKPLIKKTIFKQFVGGENIRDCAHTIEELALYNIGTILDYSVEGKESEKDFDHCVEETVASLKMAAGNKNIPFCVFKVTGLARFALLEKVSTGVSLTKEEAQEWARVTARVNEICELAASYHKPVFIDAEESWIQEAIDQLANANMAKFNRSEVIVYNTYQLYRHDRYDYLHSSIEQAKRSGYRLGAKLVRGAYMEKERKRALQMNYPSPIQKDKTATDTDYDRALQLCMENADVVSLCAGTHNENSSMFLLRLMEERNIDPTDRRFYFSQLFGMSDHISFNLSVAGYNVVKYVPYGPVKEVLPYLIRRAQENTSVKGQTGRELSLIIKEKERRRKSRA
jgi:proline dehydrogenase